jgi:hypothetical protein
MPPEIDISSLPFLSRKQLAFEHGQSLSLRLTYYSDNNSFVTIKGLTREGTFTYQATITGDKSFHTVDFRITDFPIAVSVFDTSADFAQGRLFAILSLVVNETPLFDLCSGYIYRNKGLSYPMVQSADIVPNLGFLKEVESADPAAGANATYTCPSGVILKLIGASITLVTDATVANRRMHLEYVGNNGGYLEWWGLAEQAASLTYRYSFSAVGHVPSDTSNNVYSIAIPPNITLYNGDVLRTQVAGLVAGDNMGALALLCEQFLYPG